MIRSSFTRRFILGGITGAAALCLAAGAGQAIAQSSAAGGNNTIVVVHSSEPRSFNPIIDIVKSSLTITTNVVEALVAIDEDFAVKPGLATSWTQIDPTTWEFTLRQGVKFHNGEDFDASTAATSIIATRDTPGVLQGFFQPIIDSAEAKSPDVLVIKTKRPFGGVPELMTFQYILPQKYYNDDPKKFGTEPIGTGPFKFETWQPGRSVTLARNDDYWGTKPKLDGLEFRFVPDPQTQIALLISGDVDFVEGFPADLLPGVEGKPGVSVVRVNDLRKAFLEVNTKVKPFSDPKVREALASAIDRDAIARVIYKGHAEPTTAILNSNFKSASDFADVFKYDPEKSREILKEVGPIEPVELYGSVGRFPNDKIVGEAVAGMLKNVGFEVKTQLMETGTFFNLLQSQNMPGAHVLTLAPLYPHEDFVMRTQFSTNGLYQYCGTPELEARIDEVGTIVDTQERIAAYQDLAKYIATENRCWVPLFDFVQLYGVSDRVEGLKLYPHGFISYVDVSLKQ